MMIARLMTLLVMETISKVHVSFFHFFEGVSFINLTVFTIWFDLRLETQHNTPNEL